MAEDGVDPITIPLPSTDDTIHLNTSGAFPLSAADFHSDARGSKGEGDDTVEENIKNIANDYKTSDDEEQDEEIDEGDDMTDLPTSPGKMVTLTPSFNRGSRRTQPARGYHPSSELSQPTSVVDERGNNEIHSSDEKEDIMDGSGNEGVMDNENDIVHRKLGHLAGGKVKNRREDLIRSAVPWSGESHKHSSNNSHDGDDDGDGGDDGSGDDDCIVEATEDADEMQGSEREGGEVEEISESESESEPEISDKTIKIPLHTPSRSGIPRRLFNNTSPGRTPLMRARPATATTTPSRYISSLDFTTPGISAGSFPATVGHMDKLRTPFFYHGTPLNLSRPSVINHHQLAVQNEILLDEVKEKEAQIKYLQGLVESAAASPSQIPPFTEAEMDEFISFGELDTPEKKRVRLSTGGDAQKLGELMKRQRDKLGSVTATPVPASTRHDRLSSGRTPKTSIKASPVKTLFENMTMTPPRLPVNSEGLFCTPPRAVLPQFEIKTKRQRKEEKRRRMTAQLREFSDINIDMLKGWLPIAGTVLEEVEEDGALPVEPINAPGSITPVAEEEEIVQGEQPTDRDGDLGMADVLSAAPENVPLPNTITVPAEIPTRHLNILPAVKVLTIRKRSNSAPALPHAPTTTEDDEEDEVDISISPLAQEMITALQQRVALLEHELGTSNTALQKATAQLVGEIRARRTAEEVREFLETEKKFGVCCDAARREIAAQAPVKRRRVSGIAATAAIPPPTAGKKRTRDERDASAQPEPKEAPVRPASRVTARPQEKRVYSGTSQAPPPLPPSRPTRATTARAAAAAKKPLGKAATNENSVRHPPITTGMEKPAVRGAPASRPRSRLADREDVPVSTRTTRARAGSAAGDSSRPMSRYGDRQVRHVNNDGGLDVFGRLATSSSKRR